jgi:phasin family protein
MSQKPKSGPPARAAAITKVVPEEAVVKDAPAEEQPVAEAKPMATMEPVAYVGPVANTEAVAKMEPLEEALAMEPAPMTKAEPAVEALPVFVEPPVANIEPFMEAALEAASEIETEVPDAVDKTIAAASDLTAASATALSGTITATADTVAAVTAAAVETASSITPMKPTLSQGMKSMMKSTEEFVAFGQANLEAFVKSGQIWSAGVQELTKQFANSAKASFDESVSTFKAISTAKSVKEAMELQSTFAKAALEKAMAESNKLTDASIKLTEQTLAPITARVTSAVETFGKAA